MQRKGVHVVTVNDYLARRDAEWMSPIYEALGVTVGVLQNMQPYEEKQRAYACDVVYGTNSEFGFDYLRDNMAKDLSEKVQRGHPFAIVDEVDNILIDEARTPLIISGAPEQAADLYVKFARLAPQMKAGQDTRRHGPANQEAVRGRLRLRDRREAQDRLDHRAGGRQSRALPRHRPPLPRRERPPRQPPDPVAAGRVAVQARRGLRGDRRRGQDHRRVHRRILEGRRWSEGLHQAIEAKERVAIQEENQTLATITYQNYFRLYDKLSGMTGTALTEATEFMKIYDLPVVQVPTNKPMVRDDRNDQVYKTKDGKWNAVAERDRRPPRERPAGAGGDDLRRGLRAARPSG